MEYEKIVLVTRKTRLEALVERFNTQAQARFYIEHSGGDFAQYAQEHTTYQQVLSSLRQSLGRLLKLHVIERAVLPNYLFTSSDIVVTAGIDGLVVNTAKYLTEQPLIAVNPDPEHIDGILLPFTASSASDAVRRVMRSQATIRHVTMAEARLNDGQQILAFNDLFIGVRSHVSARYVIRALGRSERHSSSGIIVSTGAGSTGWLSSMFNMVDGMSGYFGRRDSALPRTQLPFDADRLVFIVREPFISKTSGASIVCGFLTRESPLIIESQTPENGVIFSDGVEADFLEFNAGAIATVGLAERQAHLVV
jgi:NAD kinase